LRPVRAAKNENNKPIKTNKMKKTLLTSFAAFALLAATSVWAADKHTSTKFEGGKANKGTVTQAVQSGKNIVKLSAEISEFGQTTMRVAAKQGAVLETISRRKTSAALVEEVFISLS
jgi:hypothetical protein